MNFLVVFLVLGMLVSLTGNAYNGTEETVSPFGVQITDGRGRDEDLGDVYYTLYRHKVRREIETANGKQVREGLRSTYAAQSGFARGYRKRTTTIFYNQTNPNLIDEVSQENELFVQGGLGSIPFTNIQNHSAIRTGRSWAVKTSGHFFRDYNYGRNKDDAKSVSLWRLNLALPQLADLTPSAVESNRIELQALGRIQNALPLEHEEFSASKVYADGRLISNSFRSFSVIEGSWQATELLQHQAWTTGLVGNATHTDGIRYQGSAQYEGAQTSALYTNAENLFNDVPSSYQSDCRMWDSVRRTTDLALQAAYLPGRLPVERTRMRLSACPY